MKIIDFAKKGNVVRFFLGEDGLKEWYGDDWNDTPYEYNAGEVYERFISGHRDIAFPFDDLVIEPKDGTINSNWCKDDMIARKVPCVIVVPKEIAESSWYDAEFAHWIGVDGITKYYFGDRMEPEGVKRTVYRYATLMRPAGPGAVPRDGLVGCRDHDRLVLPSGHHAYSTADYDRMLDEDEVKDYELEYIGEAEA